MNNNIINGNENLRPLYKTEDIPTIFFRTLRKCGFRTLNTLEEKKYTKQEQAIWYFKCSILLSNFGNENDLLEQNDFDILATKYFKDGYVPEGISSLILNEDFSDEKVDVICSALPLANKLFNEIEGMTNEAKRLNISFSENMK